MKKRLADLAYRRCRLLEKIDAQRIEVAEISIHWQKPLALVDAGLKAAHFIHNHPTLMSGGVALLMALRPGRVWKWLQLGWVTWQTRLKLRGR